MLPDVHQDGAAQLIPAAGLLHQVCFEFPGVNRRDSEFCRPVGVDGAVWNRVSSLGRSLGRHQYPGATTRVAFDLSSPKSSFTILPASDLNLFLHR